MSKVVTTNAGSGGDGVLFEQPGGGANPVIALTKLHTGALDVDGGAVGLTNPLDIRLGDANASAGVFPAGFLRTSDEPRQIFYDPFDAALDTTNRWSAPVTTNSGVAASTTAGVMTLGTGTVANGTSVLLSQPTFTPTIPAWLGTSFAISVESPLVINGTRFWGQGTKPATPAAGAMVTDGYGFELDAAGKLYAVVYAAGVRTVIQDLSAATGNAKQPTDSAYHRYIIFYRTDRVYWYIDTLGVPVATSNFQSPTVQTLPVNLSAVGGATPPASNDAITCTGLAVWDTGKNNTQLSDGTFPWRKATVKPASTAATATDPALVMTQSPSRAEIVGTTAALGALNAVASVNAAGYSSVGFFLAAGTLIGTITPEASYDGGTTWVQATFDNPVTSLKSTTVVFGSANTVTSLSIIGSAGASQYRVRVSAFTSGTANGTLRANDVRDPSALFTAPPAQAVPGVIAAMGGSDGTNLQAVRVAAKGTQAAFLLATQPCRDSGRTLVTFTATAIATVSAEALVTLTPYRDLVAGGAATTFAVTSGKKLRIQSMVVTVRATSTVNVGGLVRLRMLAGTVLVGSPVHMSVGCMSSNLATAVIGNAQTYHIDLPEGFELSGTMQLGLTQLFSATTATIDVHLIGFEY